MACFRITGYHLEHDVCFIADSNGRFEKKWQFGAHLISKGIKIIEVGDDEKFGEGDLPKASADPDHIILRACRKGHPILRDNGIEVNGKFYIPNTRS